MNKIHRMDKPKAWLKIMLVCIMAIMISFNVAGQGRGIKWAAGGSSYYRIEKSEIVQYKLPENVAKVIITKEQLTPKEAKAPLKVSYFAFSGDQQKVLVFTNTKKVWRINSRGDYWILDIKSGTLSQLGRTLPSSSLMFAKFSPDGQSVAYVSGNNIYREELATSRITPLTTNGSVTLINGTFDWVYEEEFACRDGFRWSPDSKSIAYWQLDAGNIKKFYMINNTDSIYSQPIPIEYPKVGEKPSMCRVGVVNVADVKTTWMNIPGDPSQHYIVRMEFIPNTNDLLLQQLNRKQNHSKLFVAEASSGNSRVIHEETDEAWIELYQPGNAYTIDYTNSFIWFENGKSILWISEKDGWRHLYQVMLDGKGEKLITPGNYDIIEMRYADPKSKYLYFLASPDDATQKYLYRANLKGTGTPELQSPEAMKGSHDYSFSADGKFASHTFSNHVTQPAREFITVEDHKPLTEKESIIGRLDTLRKPSATEFFRITTQDKIEMDGWMVKPKNFDPAKKYPVVFYVYTEPAGATVSDTYGAGLNSLYDGDMTEDGYIYISLDNRGTPVPKGKAWRKSIYRQIGQVNIRDQAMAAKEILKWDFVDPDRIAVWGWSGGGSATLNLMFQYPEIYKTGIAIAAVANQLTYDNVYQERFMGLPDENMDDFVKGSPMTYARNLTGNLLIVHGTGDDNVHYQNVEMLINELVKHNKMFQVMPYPNRTHNVSEGEGTSKHLSTLYTSYLRKYCPPGAKQ